MSYFEDASIVLIPSGIKNQKIYSVKPTDGTGDLTFSRASSATRVQSDGLIEKVRENQYYKSTAFATSSLFVVYGSTPTSTGTYPVDSSSLAYSFPITAPNQGFRISLPSSSSPRCFSIYLKDFNTVSLFTTGTASVLGTTADAGTINGYVRYVVRIGAGDIVMSIRPNNNTGTATTVYATAAQLENGDFSTDYIVNDTTASVVSVGPVSGLPRLDYLGSTCPRLLLEPQTTALNQFSESFDNSYWQLKTDVTISANTTDTIDPSGYYGADKITETATTARHRIASDSVALGAGNHTASVFMKKGTARYGFVTLSLGTIYTVVVDLEDGTITATSTGGTILAQKVDNYGNGWYRISVTGVYVSGGSQYNLQFGSAGSAVPSSYNGNIPSFAGSTSNHLYAWGANLTATSYLQSYIPTLGASVTRVADGCNKTSATAIIGQTEGTLFAEVDFTDTNADQMYLTLSDGTTNNRIHIGFDNASGWLYCNIRASGAAQGLITSSAPTSGVKKIAVGYKLNDYVLYINGVQVGVDSSALVPACTRVDVGGYFSAGFEYPVKQALLFPTRLSNSDLAALTA
jgi:hypothetical protein